VLYSLIEPVGFNVFGSLNVILIIEEITPVARHLLPPRAGLRFAKPAIEPGMYPVTIRTSIGEPDVFTCVNGRLARVYWAGGMGFA
jgi:hypothetical protein